MPFSVKYWCEAYGDKLFHDAANRVLTCHKRRGYNTRMAARSPLAESGSVISTGRLSCCTGLEWSGSRAIHLSSRGFDSLQVHYWHRKGRQPIPVLQTRTAEAAGSNIPILRAPACRNKEGRADGSTRTEGSTARQDHPDKPQEVRGVGRALAEWRGRYSVKMDGDAPSCTCPDHEFRGETCKHIHAVEYTLKRETAPDGTETVPANVRVTYG